MIRRSKARRTKDGWQHDELHQCSHCYRQTDLDIALPSGPYDPWGNPCGDWTWDFTKEP